MSNGFDSVTISAMKLCAARHDPAIAADSFIALIADFARVVAGDVAQAPTLATVDRPLTPTAAGPRTPVSDAPAQHKPPRKGNGAKRHRLSYDDKVRIRARYEAELDDRKAHGAAEVRSGFIAGLAAEFGMSDSTIYSIVTNKGN